MNLSLIQLQTCFAKYNQYVSEPSPADFDFLPSYYAADSGQVCTRAGITGYARYAGEELKIVTDDI